MTIRWLCVLACCVPVGAQGEGPVSEGNALRLMRRIGLDVPE